MESIDFEDAYYIKLGLKGVWENELKQGGKVRIGYSYIKTQDILNENWTKIKNEIKLVYEQQNKSDVAKKAGATLDLNALKAFCKADDNIIFITFSDNKLWWCKLKDGKLKEDEISRYRETKIGWHNTDINGTLLNLDQISGKLTKTQGFRATLCKVKEIPTLKNLINSQNSENFNEINKAKSELIKKIQKCLGDLHWNDFELLVDLIFHQSGWKRISVLGEKIKSIDMVLEDQITKDRYQVQIKSSASVQEFRKCAEEFTGLGARKLFFVVHDDKNLLELNNKNFPNVELILSEKLAEMIVDLGLTNWFVSKIR